MDICRVSNRHKTKFDHLRRRESGNIYGSLKNDDDSSENVPKKNEFASFQLNFNASRESHVS